MKERVAPGGLVNAVDTSLQIVETLNDAETMGVTEIARELELPKSTVHNHLATLEHRDYVVREDGQYRLACRFLEFASTIQNRQSIYRVAKDEITRLATETDELAGLIVEEHNLGVFLHRATGDRAVHVDTHVGKRIYLHGAALGKAMLAFMPEDRRRAVIDDRGLPAMTDATIADEEALFEELERNRESGVAFDDEERIAGLRSVAVPIRGDGGVVLGAISIAGPTSRLSGDRFREEFPERLRSAANVIELNLAYI